MLADITRLELRLRRRSAIGYAPGMALYTLVVVALYPAFKNSASLNSLSGSTAAALFGVTGPLTSPGGWLNGNIYGNFFPLIMLLLTIGYGAACLAGQDEDGTLALKRPCRSAAARSCSRRPGQWPCKPSS
jgi:beta-exotoxin I transport system permease protein